jgi:hypothetical protein
MKRFSSFLRKPWLQSFSFPAKTYVFPVQLLPDGEGNADGSPVSAEPDGAGHLPPHLLRQEHGEVTLSDPTHHLRGLKGTWLLPYTIIMGLSSYATY